MLMQHADHPKVSSEMKFTNEKMTWNTQDTNLRWYVSKANVDHTIRGQWTVISTLDPRPPHQDSSSYAYSLLYIKQMVVHGKWSTLTSDSLPVL